MYQAPLLLSKTPATCKSHCAHVDMLSNVCLAMARTFETTMVPKYPIGSVVDVYLRDQLSSGEDVVLLPQAQPRILSYLVFMSATDTVGGMRAQCFAHRAFCNIKILQSKSIQAECKVKTCKKGIMKQLDDFEMPVSSSDCCVHLLKVFNREEMPGELEELLKRCGEATCVLEGVRFDCEADLWLPALHCTQGPIPLQQSQEDSAIFLRRARQLDVYTENESLRYCADGNLHGIDLKPEKPTTCPTCNNALSDTDFILTSAVIYQRSNIGCKRHSVFSLCCSNCDWTIPYDPNVDRLHCFSKTAKSYQAGLFFLFVCHSNPHHKPLTPNHPHSPLPQFISACI